MFSFRLKKPKKSCIRKPSTTKGTTPKLMVPKANYDKKYYPMSNSFPIKSSFSQSKEPLFSNAHEMELLELINSLEAPVNNIQPHPYVCDSIYGRTSTFAPAYSTSYPYSNY